MTVLHTLRYVFLALLVLVIVGLIYASRDGD
jgi:hypothetical protein